MVTVTHYSNKQVFQKAVNCHKNILIIGEAETNYKLNQVSYQDSKEVVRKLYGDSELTKAFEQAKDAGVPDVFVANVQIKTDYIALIDVIRQYDFTYIVPLGIKFADTFFNPILNRQMTYTELYLGGITGSSTIFMTDYHANAYEDVDHFLSDMTKKVVSFKNVSYKALKEGKNLVFVANNLLDQTYANLSAACAVCTAGYDSYPDAEFGAAVFDIDDFDIEGLEMAYFKNNPLSRTSIENLRNFRTENDAIKMVTIDKVVKFIQREMDFSDFQGKLFNEYVKVKLHTKLSEFLTSIKGTVIRDYSIQGIDFNVTTPGSGTIVNRFTVLPINSIEEFNIAMEV